APPCRQRAVPANGVVAASPNPTSKIETFIALVPASRRRRRRPLRAPSRATTLVRGVYRQRPIHPAPRLGGLGARAAGEGKRFRVPRPREEGRRGWAGDGHETTPW